MVALLAVFSGCAGPEYTSANLCVEDDFETLFPSLNGQYALGSNVHFELTHPTTRYETYIELNGEAFDWRVLDDGSIEATAVSEGIAQLHVYIDGEIVSTRALQVERPTSAEVADHPSLALTVARMLCEDCVGIAADEPRVALGSPKRFRIDYMNDAGDVLEGRGLGDDEFVDIDNGRDSLELFTDLEGLFSLPVNVDGGLVSMVSYRVAEVETLRIVETQVGFLAEALDANGVTLLGDFEWFIDDVAVEREQDVVMLEEAEGTTLRVRLGRAEASLEVL